MTQAPAPPDPPVPDTSAGTASSRRTVLAGVIAGGVLIGLFSTAFALSGTTLSDRAEAGVVGGDHDPPLPPEPTPTGTELLSAKAQAATMQDILPSAMPIVVNAPVTDEAGVLSAQEFERVSDAVAAVEEATSLRLYVVYLETFDGIAPEDWADATATKSGLTPEELLLAIATSDHVQGLSVDVNGPVSSREHASIVAASESAVADGAWADAATEAADAALATGDSGGSPGWAVLALLAVAALGAALAAGWWYLRHRRPAGETPAAPGREDAAGADELGAGDAPAVAVPTGGAASVPAPAVAVPASAVAVPAHADTVSASDDSLSDDDLAARVDDALVTLDDALRTSGQELELARAESSGSGVRELEVALADATEAAQEAFALRAALLSADEDARRNHALQALARCAEASALLDSGTATLEEVRRLKSRANRVLDESWQRAGGLDRRIEQARKDLSALAVEFPADAVKPVADNAELADHLVADARRAIDTGRAAGAKRDRAFAAAAARSAQNALGQAERLLQEAESVRTDLSDAGPRLDKAVASLTQDVADTERIAGGDPQAAMARTTARAALKQVEVTREGADPFALLARVAAAEGALDRALAGHREPSEVDARAAALVRDTLSRLDVRLRQVDTLITTRRGAVGPDARMRHSEAARLTVQAREARARSDRAVALELAQRADTQAYQALTSALRDAAADDVPQGMPLAGINLTLEGRRGHGAGAGTRGGLLGLLTRSPGHVRTGGIGGGFGGGGFGSGRAV